MHYIGRVAVVDARQDQLHEHGGLTLREVSPLGNLVEQLSTLAHSEHRPRLRNLTRDLLSDDVEPFLVFKELVHFDDVRVILRAPRETILRRCRLKRTLLQAT